MSDDPLKNQPDDLGWRFPFRMPKQKDVPPFFGNAAVFLLSLLALIVLVAAVALILQFAYAAASFAALADLEYAALRNLALILAAVIGAPFVVWRSFVAHWQARTSEQGLITSRITQAVEQLGAEKTVRSRVRPVTYTVEGTIQTRTIFQSADEDFQLPANAESGADVDIGEWTTYEQTVPNLEVRLGGIYSLERISKNSPDDHITVMEILCAYIRENSHARPPQEHGLPDWESLADDADEEARAAHEAELKERFGDIYFESKANKWARSLPQPRADIQAALTVLGRRGEDAIRREAAADRPYRPDLREANLQRADLFGLAIGPALLTGARLEGADLGGARLEGADLGGARLEGADLRGARLEGALLRETGFKSTDLRAESIRGSALRSVDLTEVSHISPELLVTAFGDGSVKVAERTAHWPEAELDDNEFYGRWRWWRESENLPWPPPGRALAYLSHYEAIPPD